MEDPSKQQIIGRSFEEARSNIDISGINRYNPTQVAQLEYVVQLMISGIFYKDFLLLCS